ncbi:MAG: MBL fold metallo-hydrolase, partial [Myxococcales bacterium]|nr:MBL fold metallo-hydrolase [Myxococcales bacterium]
HVRGKTIVMDPYLPGAFGGRIGHAPIPGPVDIVTISHEHVDHSHIPEHFGDPIVLRRARRIGDLDFRFVDCWHDKLEGESMGPNRATVADLGGIRLAHLGDLGHRLSAAQLSEIGKIDLLLLPIGGIFTLNPKEAFEVMEDVKASIVVPMHYRNHRCHLDLAFLDDFLSLCSRFELFDHSTLNLAEGSLPELTTVYALRPAL